MSVCLIVTLLVFALAGCASIRGFPERPESASKKLAELQEKFFLPDTNVLEEFEELDDSTEKRKYRDKVVYGRLLALDMQFSLFKEAIYEEGVFSNLSFDILGVAVGVAGAITSGADASRILSALSGGISGAGTAIDKNLYYERTLPALIALMDANREKIRAEILRGLTQSVVAYPLGFALADLELYLQAGSIPGAVAAVTATAGETKTKSEKKIEIVRDKAFVDPRAQKRVKQLLDLADKLDNKDALEILNAPPSEIDREIEFAIKGRLGGDARGSDKANELLAEDSNAKEILKMVVVLINDRSEENIEIWKAAIVAKIRMGE